MNDSDDPIVPVEDHRVIDLAGVRLQRGRPATPPHKRCQHHRMAYCTAERRVWCEDCKRTLDPFDALMVVVSKFGEMESEARGKLAQANDALGKTARLRATKALDRVWSGNAMAVACPHCKGGLLPEDFADGASSAWSRNLEIAARRKKHEPKA